MPQVLARVRRQVRLAAWAALVHAAGFIALFFASKHTPALARVCAFADDPYDAVGSFGVQLAFVAALLGAARILRPNPRSLTADEAAVILRCCLVAILAGLVTFASDVIAMARYHDRWVGSPAGWLLALSTTGFLCVTAALGWLVVRAGRPLHGATPPRTRPRAIVAVAVAGLALALYPESWRQSVPGAVLTALFGALLLFALAALGARMLLPAPGPPGQDVFDEGFAIGEWVRRRSPLADAVLTRVADAARHPLARRVTRWLNPREHPWRAVLLAGIALGVGIALAEWLGGGPPRPDRVGLVLAVYVGLELSGVAAGYALFRHYLGIVRS